jgi:hypothetical protein
LRLLPDDSAAAGPALPPLDDAPPARQLDAALAGIARRHGADTASFVATQLEYPGEIR